MIKRGFPKGCLSKVRLVPVLAMMMADFSLIPIALGSSSKKGFPDKSVVSQSLSKKAVDQKRKEGKLLIEVVKPRTKGQGLKIRVQNQTDYDIGMLRFSLQAYGGFTTIELSQLKKGGSEMRRLEGRSWKELMLEHFVIVDSQANRREPELDIKIH